MRFRKLLIIAIVVLMSAGILAVIGLFIRSQETPPGEALPGPSFREFFPFGKGLRPGGEETPIPPTETPSLPDTPTPIGKKRIWQISLFPVAGAGIYETRRTVIDLETSEEVDVIDRSIRYISRAEGYAYQSDFEGTEEKRITQTLLPKVYEAVFGNNAGVAVLRYIKDDEITISTYAATLPKIIEGGDSVLSLSGVFLPDNIIGIAASPDKTKIFYIEENPDGVIGTLSKTDGSEKKVVWGFPFTEWLVDWTSPDAIVLTSKPSSDIEGYAYALHPVTGVVRKLLGGKEGLTVLLSPNGEKIAYAETVSGEVRFRILDITTGGETDVSFSTLPEKCAWTSDSDALYCGVPFVAPQGALPDIWYQGLVSFDDSLWKIDAETGNGELVVDPKEEAGQYMDIIEPFLGPEESYVFFINKKNGTLWSVRTPL